MSNSTSYRRSDGKSMLGFLKGVNPAVYLFGATVLALILANSPWSSYYFSLLETPINLQIGDWQVFSHHGRTMNLGEFINDALMCFFFFSVGLEIKHEMVGGSLSDFKTANLPVLAAIGGMVIPVACFALVESGNPTVLRGAAIPMSTDIAFSLAALGLLGSRVPTTLKVFLMALAVVDDIGGILVIAIFYSEGLALFPLLIAAALLIITRFCGQRGVYQQWFYYLMFFFVWLCFLQGGIHTTIAGVLLAFCVPYVPLGVPKDLMDQINVARQSFDTYPVQHSKNRVYMSASQLDTLTQLRNTSSKVVSPVQRMNVNISPFVNYVVLPLFAFSNAGIALGDVPLSDFAGGVPFAVMLGLVVGKPLGIFLFTWLFTKLGVVSFPPGMTKRNLLGVGMFAGIGFTVSLFVATLAYPASLGAIGVEYLNDAKLGILLGSLISGVVAYYYMRAVLKKEVKEGRGAASPEYQAYLKTQSGHPQEEK